jgi:hypothetical protein
MAASARADTSLLLRRALEAQRRRTARVLALVRLAGVAAALALGLAMTYGAAETDWKVLVPILGTYAAAALLLALAVYASDRAAHWAGAAVALVDVPMAVAPMNIRGKIEPLALYAPGAAPAP